MHSLNITEAGPVQFPMVRLKAEVGWTPMVPRDAVAMYGGQKFHSRTGFRRHTDLRSKVEGQENTMNRAERPQQKKQNKKQPGRKFPITIPAVVGMLESSARLDGIAADKRRSEAAESGTSTGQRMDWHGKSYEVIDLPEGYSIGITLSAQIIAGQAAELVLKYAYENEHPNESADLTHDLDVLFKKLSQDRRNKIEEDYTTRIQLHKSPPGQGWQTVEQVFHSGKGYPVLFRYATEEGQAFTYMEPIFLREAVCSVLASLGANVRWGS